MLKLFLLVCFTVNVLVFSLPFDESVIEEHIVGGNKTDITEVPYQIVVYYQDVPICGGFIVSPKYVVTSAQCLHYLDPALFSIRAGSSSTKKGGVMVEVKDYKIHPKYHYWDKEYDVSVLELANPLKLDNKTMKAIKLATKEPSKGTPTLLSGYGALDKNDRVIGVLHSAVVPIYDRAECKKFYERYNITITPAITCAGGNKVFMDLADEGGALVYKNEVVGVVSFRYGYGGNKRPNVFTNAVHPDVAKFIKEAAKL